MQVGTSQEDPLAGPVAGQSSKAWGRRFHMLSCAPAGEDVIIGKTTPVPEEAPGVAQRFQRRDISQSLRNSESGMVDQVLVTTNPDGQKFVKLRVGQQRPLHPVCQQTETQLRLSRQKRVGGCLSLQLVRRAAQALCSPTALAAATPPSLLTQVLSSRGGVTRGQPAIGHFTCPPCCGFLCFDRALPVPHMLTAGAERPVSFNRQQNGRRAPPMPGCSGCTIGCKAGACPQPAVAPEASKSSPSPACPSRCAPSGFPRWATSLPAATGRRAPSASPTPRRTCPGRRMGWFPTSSSTPTPSPHA